MRASKTIRTAMTRVILATTLAVASASAVSADEQGTTAPFLGSFVDDAMSELGFNPAHRVDLESGAVVSVGLSDHEQQSNQLTVGAVMMLVRRPLAVVSQALVDDATFRVDTKVLDYRTIGDGSESREEIDAMFQAVGFTKKESAESARLLRFRGGTDFNLSDAEVAGFRSIREAEGSQRALASAGIADVLLQRYLAYLDRGLEGVEPYTRGGRRRASPRRELTIAFSSLEILERYFPEFHTSLLRFPEMQATGIGSQFYWVKRMTGDRPAFTLAHRMEQGNSDYTVAAELQFYVGHS